MARHIQAIILTEQAHSADQLFHPDKPKFVFVAELGRKSIDEIESDLVLVPVLAGMKVPRELHSRHEGVGELIKSAIKDGGFEGKRGDHLLLATDLCGSCGDANRHVFVAGIGRAEKFTGRTAFDVFQKIIEEAIRLDVQRVMIPFAPNRGTKGGINMKGMGHKLKMAVNAVFSRLEHPVRLTEVQIYCTPQAKPHIEKGLQIPVG